MKNRLGIEDAGALSRAEREYTEVRGLELKNGTAPAATRGHFDADHLRAIHRHTFQDVYEWAGTTRGDDLTLEGQRQQQPVQLIKGRTSFEEGPKVNAKLDGVFGPPSGKLRLLARGRAGSRSPTRSSCAALRAFVIMMT